MLLFTYLLYSHNPVCSLSSDRQLSQSNEQISSTEDITSRRGSTPSDCVAVFPAAHLYSSNPDLASLASSCDDAGTLGRRRRQMPEHVLKIFRADQTFRYLVVYSVGVASDHVCPMIGH